MATLSATSTAGTGRTLRRLRRDHEELRRDPVDGCAAYPVTDNLLEWHADLFPLDGPLEGVRFHLTLMFPADYPKSPPRLRFPGQDIPSFRHPNLYGTWLCLDMLQGFIGSEDRLSGWSSAYSVRSILLQLQGFLFDLAPQDHGGPRRGAPDRSEAEAP